MSFELFGSSKLLVVLIVVSHRWTKSFSKKIAYALLLDFPLGWTQKHREIPKHKCGTSLRNFSTQVNVN